MAEISAQGVGVVFRGGHTALRDVTFEVRSGEFVSFLGPSGCGKSTLLRMIAGLLAPMSGQIQVAGQSPEAARKNWHRLAYVFQEPNLLPWRSVRDNIRLPLELERMPGDRQAQLVADSLRLIGLTPRDADKRPAMLSGGMKMRVSLARALVTSPHLLLLDEPFGALDDLLRQQLNEELLRIWLQQGWTAVFVTHNVAEAVYLSERILVLGRSPGRVVHEVPVPFGRNRTADLRGEPEFARLCGQVSRWLREASQ
ncbi:MAG: ABC transporter ATP-binding protein [Pirellulaceae bacterium]|jgi:NitT/TauT family transport system ATP-binding protein|nr:ABC transporter ATP-binding protein [Pirellulaceae bacterium]MCU0982256.1 ABC transporter ATP-binding protein [Pirellulaceae bacterium]